jgi:hypothetical protein
VTALPDAPENNFWHRIDFRAAFQALGGRTLVPDRRTRRPAPKRAHRGLPHPPMKVSESDSADFSCSDFHYLLNSSILFFPDYL